jgi:hypothetical protein
VTFALLLDSFTFNVTALLPARPSDFRLHAPTSGLATTCYVSLPEGLKFRRCMLCFVAITTGRDIDKCATKDGVGSIYDLPL